MKKSEIRNANIAYELSNTANPGAMGRAFELSCVRSGSRKTTVSKQGQVDVSVKVMVNGKARYMPAECKTNGGRVNDLLDGSNKSAFVIYRLDFVQKFKATKTAPAREEIRHIPPVIIPTALFVAMLTECNAIKAISHGGVQDGIAIQPSSKRMYERLTAYIDNYGEAVLFDNTKTYEAWDFEGLEI